MYRIYIDSSQRKIKSVELYKLGDTTKEKEVKLEVISGDIDIVKSIQVLLKKHNIQPKNISNIESSPGPGSFTGLKLGATIANVFNWAVHNTQLISLKYPEYGSEPNIQLPDRK